MQANSNNTCSSCAVKQNTRKISKITVSRVLMIIILVVLIIYCLSLFIPIIWMIVNSFKTYEDIYLLPPYALPKNWVWDNYIFVLKNLTYTANTVNGRVTYGLIDMFVSSILWSTLNPLFSVIVTTLVAYVISRYKFVGRNFLYNLGIIVMIIPVIGSLGSAMKLRQLLGVYDNMVLLILTSPATAFSGLNFLIMYSAFKGIPWAYAESVFMDGGGHVRVLISIMLPMILPTCTVLFLLGFIGGWNDYESFLIWMPSSANVALGMFNFQSNSRQGGGTLPQILSGFVIVSIPTIILFVSFQSLITQKVMVGGLKG